MNKCHHKAPSATVKIMELIMLRNAFYPLPRKSYALKAKRRGRNIYHWYTNVLNRNVSKLMPYAIFCTNHRLL